MNHRPLSRPARLRAALLILTALFAPIALATGPIGDGGPMVPGAQTMPPPERAPARWHTFGDAELGFAVDVPDTHVVARSGPTFAVHTFHYGEPTVRDMTLTFFEGATVDRVLRESYPEGAQVDEVTLGPGTSGVKVTFDLTTVDGTAYQESSYLVAGRSGVVRIARHESFAWDPFDDVARSFRWWTQVPAPDAGE